MIDVAAVQARFGLPSDAVRLDAWRAQVRGPLQPIHGATNRTIRVVEAEPELRFRRERFRLLLLRRAYKLDYWLPPEAIVNVRRIDWDDTGARLLLTLWSGTQLLDTGDRITVRGTVDDVAISELVTCVERRGWSVVTVSGDDEFRADAARELLRQGIEVEDCPLSWDEQERLRSLATQMDIAPVAHAPRSGIRV